MGTVTGFSGSLLVIRDGQPVLRVSAGLADSAADVPCAPDTRFQIASVSKQLTAAVVLSLVDDGAVTLTDHLARLLPGCPAIWQELTLHQLLSHTSGLGHWGDLPGFDVTQPGSPDELLQRLAAVPLRSAPGRAWRYSSPGYLLAARVVEACAGASYADVLTERVLRPVGMAATVVGRTPPEPAAWGYRVGHRADVAEFAAIPGTGDVWSTVDDLARYTAAFEAGQVLSADARRAMVTAQTAIGQPDETAVPDDPAPADAYGYGYFLGTVCGHRARFHPGDNPGYQSFLAYLPDLRATVALLVNDEETDRDAVLRQLAPLLAAEPDLTGPGSAG